MVHAGVKKYCVLLYLTEQYQYIKNSYFVWVIYFEFVNISIFVFKILFTRLYTFCINLYACIYLYSLSPVFLTTHLITPGGHQSLNPY